MFTMDVKQQCNNNNKIKLKVLKRSGTLYDLNGSHSSPASSQPSNRNHPDPDPPLGSLGSILKGSHVQYQIEDLDENY